MKHPAYTMLIPAPAECVPQTGCLPLSQLTRLDADPAFAALVPEVLERTRYLELDLSGAPGAVLALRRDPALLSEAWSAAVTSEGITLRVDVERPHLHTARDDEAHQCCGGKVAPICAVCAVLPLHSISIVFHKVDQPGGHERRVHR